LASTQEIVDRGNGEHACARGDVFADTRFAIGDDTVDRRPYSSICERELGREQSRFGRIDPRLRYAYIRVDHHELLVLVGKVGRRLIDLRMGLHLCRLGVVERGLGSESVLGQNRCAHQGGVGIHRLSLRRTQSCFRHSDPRFPQLAAGDGGPVRVAPEVWFVVSFGCSKHVRRPYAEVIDALRAGGLEKARRREMHVDGIDIDVRARLPFGVEVVLLAEKAVGVCAAWH
jgi:hypothetical protein